MEETSTAKPQSAFTLFTKSKDLVLANYQVFGALLLVPFLLSLFSEIAARSDSGSTTGQELSGVTLGFGFAGIIIFLVVNVIISLMTYMLTFGTAQGKKPTLGEVWEKFKQHGGQLFMLLFTTGLIVMGGLILFIVPGLIFLRRYYLAPYVMLDKNLSVGDSLKESARMSKPYSGSIWGIFGVTILLSLTGLLPVIGWLLSLVLTGLYAVAPALRYFELKKLVK